MKGRYEIVRLKKKPSWISRDLWIRMFRAGLLEDMVLGRTAVENLIVHSANHGVQLFLQHLGGVTTYPLALDNCSIGSGTTAPADGDTDLDTPEVEDIPVATIDINTNDIVTTWFFSDDELPNGTYEEFGIFCGTQLFARSLISPAHTKGTNEDTLIEYTISVDNAI